MEVLKNGQFVMNESVHLICRETEINGKPAAQAKYTLKSGNRVKVTRYRIRKRYFVYSMTVL